MALLAVLLALALTLLSLLPRMPRGLPWVAAVLNLAFAGLLTGYVFRTQPAFGGRTAWSLRVDGGEHRRYFVAIGVAAVSAVAFGLLAVGRRRNWQLRGAFIASGIANLVLGWLVLIAFEID